VCARGGPRAEETRVGEMEGPWIAQYVGLRLDGRG